MVTKLPTDSSFSQYIKNINSKVTYATINNAGGCPIFISRYTSSCITKNSMKNLIKNFIFLKKSFLNVNKVEL